MIIASHGRPGAGKSTFTGMLRDELAGRGRPVALVKLGVPLYELQAAVYRAAGMPVPESGRQDGALLNALGEHLRRINPGSLTSRFERTVSDLFRDRPDSVVLCDDMRPADTAALRGLGAVFVRVWAPEGLRLSRKSGRGDLSKGADDHPTEGDIAEYDHQVENTGSLTALRERARGLAAEVLR
ncbi:hypothetical protein GCM10009759_03830 [Kitasatospora saccharophila]|uniref:Dephospho-CoA kinase n=1 Tax=Kitasatospora saccharophila TaxID=407973 RepID=A0ABN2W5Z5_9ACTN